jgi:amidase
MKQILLVCFAFAFALSAAGAVVPRIARAQQPPRSPAAPAAFEVFEKSILELQEMQFAGKVTSRALVEAYIARIKAYDQGGPKLNAIVMLNPHALEEADALDRERAHKGPRGPLHGIPVLVKDNYDTIDMPTGDGTLGLATLQSSADAFQVKRLRRAGAVILGKTTMHELAAGITTISSLTGATRNPYDPARVPGGSSGGSAAAVAASFAAAAMGSDTSGSLRIPAAFQSLVALRVTRGLSSRAGVAPLSSTQDVAGPLARSVTDLAILLDATVGTDPDDAVTASARGHIPKTYREMLRPDGLRGARIGVLSSMFGHSAGEEESGNIVRKALEAMKARGAELVDVSIPGLDDLMHQSGVIDYEFKFDLADYLARHPDAPVKSLGEILDRGLYHEQLEDRLRLRNRPETRDTDAYRGALEKRRELHDVILAALEQQHLDALVFPTLVREPAFIGEGQGGADACQLSANSGLPEISVPAGFSANGLPVGMELLGKDFDEPLLLKLAYAWEQATKPRRAPFSTPPLIDGRAPAPLEFDASVRPAISPGPTAYVKFRYDATTASLDFDATVSDLGEDGVIALTLQRGQPDTPGPVVAHLLLAGQTAAHSTLTLRGPIRGDLLANRLFLHLYTLKAPLGLPRSEIRLGSDARHPIG